LNQVATIAIPEARSVIITPFDKSLISEIEKAIQVADLGLNPSNDGKVIRIQIPALTADRRKELVKQAKTVAENSRTAIRNIRRDGNDDLKKQQKDGTLTEDGLKTETDKLQKLTDKYIEEINKIYDSKEKDILQN
jgi:ribosome recycling factor